jgi:hypothetical protein
MRPLLFSLLALCACAGVDESPALSKIGRVEGTVEGPEGNAWLFLYGPGEGFPGLPAVPKYATAVSADRRIAGDSHYVFAQVSPNPYRLWAFDDVDRNFDPSVDVLAQPGAGDRAGVAVELNLQPGKTMTQAMALTQRVADEPPAFALEGVAGTEVALDDQPNATTALTMLADSAGGRLDKKKVGFPIGLVDADGNGQPDDADGDGVPDLSLTVILRFLPLPGQVHAGSTVIVPVLINPAPFLATLNGSLTEKVVVDRLQGYVVPQAQELVAAAPGKAVQINPIGQPPAGQYELVVLAASGQYWRMPNDLKGVLPEQGVRFHFDRAAP